MHPSTQRGGRTVEKWSKGGKRGELRGRRAQNDYVRGNHTLQTIVWAPFETLRPHFPAAQRQRGAKEQQGQGGSVRGWHGMCVSTAKRQVLHKCCTNTKTRTYLKKKKWCAQHGKQLKPFLHNITCQNCSLEKYFAIFGCASYKMSATNLV